MSKFQHPPGLHDILPDDIPQWRFVEETFRSICQRANFQEIRTPIFEHTELFARASGESSDVVVTKQMYTFEAGDDSYTLRPEGTASVVRSYLENHLNSRGPVTKLFYIFPIFRHEAVQADRYRQHHQCGIEMLGASGPEADAEVLALSRDFLYALGIKPILHLNSLGTMESRRDYIATLRAFLEPKRDQLSADSKRRLEVNPLRIFDSKEACDHQALQGAPRLLDHIRENDPESLAHFETLCRFLDELNIPYEVDHDLVRGFDYYSRTAFEWVTDKTVLGGGRYDGLVEELGGPPTPGIGFGAGIERLLRARENSEQPAIEPERLTSFLVTLGDAAHAAAPRLLAQVRANGISCERDFVARSMRQQMREAGRQNTRFCLIVGDDELNSGTVALKDMDASEQQSLPLAEACALMAKAASPSGQ